MQERIGSTFFTLDSKSVYSGDTVVPLEEPTIDLVTFRTVIMDNDMDLNNPCLPLRPCLPSSRCAPNTSCAPTRRCAPDSRQIPIPFPR